MNLITAIGPTLAKACAKATSFPSGIQIISVTFNGANVPILQDLACKPNIF